ncbi:polyprenyl synthetase family protein [Bacteroidota bacterium]
MERKYHIFEAKINKRIAELDFFSEPKRLYEPIDYILSIGGKRLRPVLLLMSNELFSGNINKAVSAAIGIEVFHNFTLLHDDVMDNASIRRNQTTVHTKWDINTAILSGDAMAIKAYEFIADCDEKYIKSVLKVFNKVALQVCEGQQFDMDFEDKDDVTVEQYMNMIKLKTAVLIAGGIKIGAILAGASLEDSEYLYKFGENIGIAFQLQDDYLDVYGNVDVFGKQIGGDIISNKKTFLLVNTLEIAGEVDKKELLKWIYADDFDPKEKIKAVTELYNNQNIKELTKLKMNEYLERALLELKKVSVGEEAKIELEDIARKLTERIS